MFSVSVRNGKWTVTINDESHTAPTVEEAIEMFPQASYTLAVRVIDKLSDHCSMETWNNRSYIERILGRVL